MTKRTTRRACDILHAKLQGNIDRPLTLVEAKELHAEYPDETSIEYYPHYPE